VAVSSTSRLASQIQADALRVSAVFGFYMHVRKPNGKDGPLMFFNYVDGARQVVVYVRWKPETVPEAVLLEYKSELKAVLGAAFHADALEPNVPLAAIGENLDGFKNAIGKLQKRIDPDSNGSMSL